MEKQSFAASRLLRFWASALFAVTLVGFATLMRNVSHIGGGNGSSLAAQDKQCAKNDVLPSISDADDKDVVYFVGCGGFF